jgi:cob(I)alamin adenosyltransferase
MKIYTKTGDQGTTSLFAGGRVTKADVRLHAYGTVDELNATLGLVIALNVEASLISPLRRIQNELFSVGADLATPLDAEAEWITRLDGSFAQRLEQEMDTFDTELTPLKNFILPGGSPSAAALHQARTICRRAERWIATMGDAANPEVLIYINRLSDWLFVAARMENARKGIEDPIWVSH